MSIRLFSTPNCPYCKLLKDFLEEKGVEHEHIDVTQDSAAASEMVEKSGQMGVPVLDVNGNFLVGFNKQAVIQALDLNGA